MSVFKALCGSVSFKIGYRESPILQVHWPEKTYMSDWQENRIKKTKNKHVPSTHEVLERCYVPECIRGQWNILGVLNGPNSRGKTIKLPAALLWLETSKQMFRKLPYGKPACVGDVIRKEVCILEGWVRRQKNLHNEAGSHFFSFFVPCLNVFSFRKRVQKRGLKRRDGDPVICGRPVGGGGSWGLLIALHDHIIPWEDEAILALPPYGVTRFPMVWPLFSHIFLGCR